MDAIRCLGVGVGLALGLSVVSPGTRLLELAGPVADAR